MDDDRVDLHAALERAKETRRRLEDLRLRDEGISERLRDLRSRDEGLRSRWEQLHRDVQETARGCARTYGRVLGYRLPDAEPVDNERWFDFLVDHPELTGWDYEQPY